MEVKIIESGYFLADGGAAFGLLPRRIWSRLYPADRQNECRMAMRCVLLVTENKKILLDTGPGFKQLDRLKGYKFQHLIAPDRQMKEWGISPEEITDVVLSHLHFDHCGYATRFDETTGRIVPSFPQAKYYAGKSQWERSLSPGLLDFDAYFPENMQAIERARLLELIENEYQIDENIYIRSYDGHTPGQLVTFFSNGQDEYVFAGDTVPLALNCTLRSISAFDLCAETAARVKRQLLRETAERNRILIFSHDAYTCAARIKKVNDSFKIKEKIAL